MSNLKQNTFLLLGIISLLVMASCGRTKQNQIGENEYYVCSMDPQVMEKQPGLCPICKMDLTKTVIDKSQMQVIKLNADQMKLANILVDTLNKSSIGREYSLTGIFSINQNKTEQISARINGRIEKLYLRIIGEQVKKGDKLYDLYSRELLLAQEEYLMAIEKSTLLPDYGNRIVNAAKSKLLLWGFTEEQLKKLSIEKKAQLTTTIYSKVAGVITAIPLKEGDYVSEGSMIYQLTDLNSLWVEAQLYSNEISNLNEGQEVEIIPEGFPGERLNGKVSFANPELQAQSKINLIRIEIDNSRRLYKPGMQARVQIKSAQKQALIVPMDAVLQDGKHTVVWVQVRKAEFEARMVTTGLQSKGNIEILSGLKAGDRVVVSGTYLLNSEYIFKRGTTPMSGHDMKM